MEELKPTTEERPWGWFRVLAKSEKVTVKILFVKKGEVFSFQKHQHRSEFWRILSGEPSVTIGDKDVKAKIGDEFDVPMETEHRIEAQNNDVEVLEISRGEFNENDIVRIEDKYGRT